MHRMIAPCWALLEKENRDRNLLVLEVWGLWRSASNPSPVGILQTLNIFAKRNSSRELLENEKGKWKLVLSNKKTEVFMELQK